MGLGLSLAPSLGRDDTHDAWHAGGDFRPFQAKRADTPPLANRPFSPPRHEGEGESDNERLCGAFHPVTDQNAKRGDVRVKK